MRTLFAAGLFAATLVAAAAADKPEKVLEDAVAAFDAGKYKEAAELADKAAKLDPKAARAPFVAGSARAALRENAAAVTAFTAAIDRDPKLAVAYDRRGDAQLKLGKFKEAIADFDTFLEMKPKFAPEHWRRGIALYYAGRFDDGRKQFDLHRTVNPEDVENSAWHYLCNARANTPKKAREDLIPVTRDARVPMKQVLDLFAGKLKPQDVIDSAEAAKLEGEALTEARFYAHLYVALYYESEKDEKKALDHLTTAVEKYKIGHYMWDVGNAQLAVLKKQKKD
ncbi:MAG: nlpI [Gemmataceae bacterium]|nr:nlpI [Gemmataceae bacterium]